jgi:DNA-binding PadR family transcriptional regulator
MAMKEAVLGLVLERPGYGYELINRFNERFGETWRLNPGTVYEAIDRLERDGFITGDAAERAQSRGRGTRRQHVVIYRATPAARERFLTWLTAPTVGIEPVRGEILLKMGMTTRPDQALALIQVIDAQIDACADALAQQLARYHLDPGIARMVPWRTVVSWFMTEAGITRLQADLTWLRRLRAAAEAFRAHGAIPLELLTARPGMPPGWIEPS